MDGYIVALTIIGIAALGMAWMPAITKKTRISYSIIYVAAGAILFTFLKDFPSLNPLVQEDYTLHLAELVVIVSLMGTGLKIDQPFSFKKWATPFRLVVITMILCIAIVTMLGVWSFNFDWGSALLLGAVLAPTDPVLASDVQVGPPHEDNVDNIKFSLTAEAGMNDGMAFPFTWLAVVVATFGSTDHLMVSEWFAYHLLYKIAAGILVGFAMGKLLSYLLFDLPHKKKIVVIDDGFVALSATLTVYGLTELVHGYGFIAVFITAITLRNHELHHKLHKNLHSFTDQIERILLAIVLIIFGGSLVSGILSELTWQMAAFGFAFLFIIRPLTGLVALIGTRLHIKEKLAISFFGIRGIGTFFYLAFALKETHFLFGRQLWSLVAFIVLISILVHGLTANTIMQKLENEFSKPKKRVR